MPTLEQLTALAVGIPAVAALVSATLGGIPGRWAPAAGRWTVRLGLLLSMASLATLLVGLQPSGVVQVTLWQVAPRLPIDLQGGVGGVAVAIAVLLAALVVGGMERDGPLSSAALAVAATGGVLVALAGGLLSIFVGLQLSAVGGIGLSYARHPRAPSWRVMVAAVADQAMALIWLGAAVSVYGQTGSMLLSGIPTQAVTSPLATLLALPGVARLGGALLLAAPAPAGPDRGRDVADWVAVVAAPTGFALLLRTQQLAGGAWPNPSLGTGLDAVAIALLVGAVLIGRLTDRKAPRGGAVLAIGAALVLLGFGMDSPAGAALACLAAAFLQMSALVLPRLAERRVGARLNRWVATSARLSVSAPVSLGAVTAVVGLALAIASGPGRGLAPAIGFAGALATVGLVARRGMSADRVPWPALVPALLLAAAALLPGLALTLVAQPIITNGAGSILPLTAPDPLSLEVPGMLWPAGYLAVIGTLGGTAFGLLRWLSRSPAPAEVPEMESGSWPSWTRVGEGLAGARQRLDRPLGALRLGMRLAERELAERPVWLWLATALAAGWLLAQR